MENIPSNIFLYTTWKLGSSLYIYICYLHMCLGQRGGGHGRITEFAGHIIHQSTWHTVFRGECSEMWQKWRYSSLLQQYKPRFSCTCQTLPVWNHNGRMQLLLCIRTASALLTRRSCLRCESDVTHRKKSYYKFFLQYFNIVIIPYTVIKALAIISSWYCHMLTNSRQNCKHCWLLCNKLPVLFFA